MKKMFKKSLIIVLFLLIPVMTSAIDMSNIPFDTNSKNESIPENYKNQTTCSATDQITNGCNNDDLSNDYSIDRDNSIYNDTAEVKANISELKDTNASLTKQKAALTELERLADGGEVIGGRTAEKLYEEIELNGGDTNGWVGGDNIAESREEYESQLANYNQQVSETNTLINERDTSIQNKVYNNEYIAEKSENVTIAEDDLEDKYPTTTQVDINRRQETANTNLNKSKAALEEANSNYKAANSDADDARAEYRNNPTEENKARVLIAEAKEKSRKIKLKIANNNKDIDNAEKKNSDKELALLIAAKNRVTNAEKEKEEAIDSVKKGKVLITDKTKARIAVIDATNKQTSACSGGTDTEACLDANIALDEANANKECLKDKNSIGCFKALEKVETSKEELETKKREIADAKVEKIGTEADKQNELANPGLKTLGSDTTMNALLGITDNKVLDGTSADSKEGGFTVLSKLTVWFKDSLNGLVQILSVGAFLFVGIRLAMARGNPEEFKKALMHMIYVILGIFIITISWAAVVLVAGITI